jgi:hypothetical protein
MTNPIRAALEKAAKAALSDLSDRKGIGNELEQCDEDIQAEIGKAVAAKAIAAFLRALPISDVRVPFYAFWHPLARATEDAAKDESHD